MNQIGYVKTMQGPYDPAMDNFGATPLDFVVPATGNVLVMAQATALCSNAGGGNHTVSLVFTLFDDTGNQRAQEASHVKLQHPCHGLVPMAYLKANGLNPATPAKLTIAIAPGNTGSVGPDDYFSIAVVELEQVALREEEQA